MNEICDNISSMCRAIRNIQKHERLENSTGSNWTFAFQQFTNPSSIVKPETYNENVENNRSTTIYK